MVPGEKERECKIPKSVGALHQSANALILTTNFSPWLPLDALPKTLLSKPGSYGSLSAPESYSTLPGHSEEGGLEASDQHGVPKSTQGWVEGGRGGLWRLKWWLWSEGEGGKGDKKEGGSGLLRCIQLPSRGNTGV